MILDQPENIKPQKSFVIFELILTVVALIGLLFKIQHWAGVGIILVLSLNSLAMFYFPLGFYFLKDHASKGQNKVLLTLTSLFHSITVVGLLLKLQRWQGGHIYMVIGLIASTLLLLAYLYLQKHSSTAQYLYNKKMALSSFIFVVVAAIGSLL